MASPPRARKAPCEPYMPVMAIPSDAQIQLRCASPTYVDNAIFAGAAPWRAGAAVSPIGIT
jgi:hypothetical protein